jgi:GntR family transcriptional regulator
MKWVEKGAVRLWRPHDIAEGTIEYLATSIGLKQVSYRDLISARLPTVTEQELFGLTHNHTVIEVVRTSFTEDETPIRVTITVFPSDRNQIAYDMGPVPVRLSGSADSALAASARGSAGGGDGGAA